MAAEFIFQEDNGAAVGSPAKGSTRTTTTNVNWKSVDDTTTPITSAPVDAGDNSFAKYQFGKFTGTFTKINGGLFAHTAGTLPTGVTLYSKVTSTYQTPSETTITGYTDITTPELITDGAQVLYSTTGPEGTVTATELTTAGYTQYLITQAITTGSAPTGPSEVITLTFRYSEQ